MKYKCGSPVCAALMREPCFCSINARNLYLQRIYAGKFMCVMCVANLIRKTEKDSLRSCRHINLWLTGEETLIQLSQSVYLRAYSGEGQWGRCCCLPLEFEKKRANSVKKRGRNSEREGKNMSQIFKMWRGKRGKLHQKRRKTT